MMTTYSNCWTPAQRLPTGSMDKEPSGQRVTPLNHCASRQVAIKNQLAMHHCVLGPTIFQVTTAILLTTQMVFLHYLASPHKGWASSVHFFPWVGNRHMSFSLRRISSNAASWSSTWNMSCSKQGGLSRKQAPGAGNLQASRAAAHRPVRVARLMLLVCAARGWRSVRSNPQTARCPGKGNVTGCPGSWAFSRQWLRQQASQSSWAGIPAMNQEDGLSHILSSKGASVIHLERTPA